MHAGAGRPKPAYARRTGLGRSKELRDIISGVMSWRSGLILVALLVWAVNGPIGMAFDGCALSCDEPCSLTTASISLSPTVPFIVSVAGTASEPLRGRGIAEP